MNNETKWIERLSLREAIAHVLELTPDQITTVLKFDHSLILKSLKNTWRTMQYQHASQRQQYFKKCLKHYKSLSNPIVQPDYSSGSSTIDEQVLNKLKLQNKHKPWATKSI